MVDVHKVEEKQTALDNEVYKFDGKQVVLGKIYKLEVGKLEGEG